MYLRTVEQEFVIGRGRIRLLARNLFLRSERRFSIRGKISPCVRGEVRDCGYFQPPPNLPLHKGEEHGWRIVFKRK